MWLCWVEAFTSHNFWTLGASVQVQLQHPASTWHAMPASTAIRIFSSGHVLLCPVGDTFKPSINLRRHMITSLKFFCEKNCIQRGSIAILPVHLHVLHPTGQSLQSSHEPSCLHPCSWCVPSIQTIHLTNSYQMLPNGSTPHAHCLVPWPNRSPRRKSQTHCQLSAPRLLLHSIHTYEYLNNQGFGHYFDTLFNAWHCLLLWQHQ